MVHIKIFYLLSGDNFKQAKRSSYRFILVAYILVNINRIFTKMITCNRYIFIKRRLAKQHFFEDANGINRLAFADS